MADKAFRELVDAAGGSSKFIECMNAVINETGSPMNQFGTRTLYSWISGEGVPRYGHIWILAACLRAGLTRDQAIAVYPELTSALCLAMLVTDKKAA
jgi:hypothetical protein